MVSKVIYFTAGSIPTTEEQADIDKLVPLTVPSYEVVVRRGDGVGTLMFGAATEAADYVAGTPPSPYDDPDDYPVIDPDDLPDPPLAADKAIVTDGQIVGSYTITVVDNVVTAIAPV